MLLFDDRNNDDSYTNGVDSFLGTGSFSGPIAAGNEASVQIPVSGIVEFDGNLVHALIDPSNLVLELDEANNGSFGATSRHSVVKESRPPKRPRCCRASCSTGRDVPI